MNNVEQIIKKMNDRLDDIEKLLQMIIVNDLVNETELIISPAEVMVSKELQLFFNSYSIKYCGFSTINDVQVFIIKVPEAAKLKINDYRALSIEIRKYYPERVPLFNFKTINGMQRKRLIQEEISFGVQKKEYHVFNRE